MKKFTSPCDFAGAKAPFNIYIGEPAPKLHPLQFQALWFQEERGGQVPLEVMDSFQKLHVIALENSVSFEDLCIEAFGTPATENASGEAKKDEQ